MNGDKDLVSFAMNANRVIIVFVLVCGRSELNVDVFCNARRQHALLVAPNFEKVSLWRQNVKPLRRGRIIDQPHLHRVGLIRFKTRKFHHRRTRLEDAIRAYSIIDVFFGYN